MTLDNEQERQNIDSAMSEFVNDPIRGPYMNYWNETDLLEWDKLLHAQSLLIPVIVDK